MDRKDWLRNMLILALADGILAQEEIDLIRKRCDDWGLSKEQFDAAVRRVESPDVELKIPATADQRRQLLADLAEVISADGKFTELEKNLFALAAVRLEITDEDLDAILDEFM